MNIEKAEQELLYSGFTLDGNYENMCGPDRFYQHCGEQALKVLKYLDEQKYTDFQLDVILNIVDRLRHEINVGPITPNKDEWELVDVMDWHSKVTHKKMYRNRRNKSIYSFDLKTFVDFSDPTSTGMNDSGHIYRKPVEEMVQHEFTSEVQ